MYYNKEMTTYAKKPSKIIGIQFSLLSPEEIERNSVAEITNKETYNGMKPKIGGLFDPRMGVLEPGIVCPTDGENYINCPGYFGHIKMARPLFYIQYIEEITKILRCVCIKCSRLLIDKKDNINLLSYSPTDRWHNVFAMASKVKRCGDSSLDGCECLQPTKIRKEGFATIIADWNTDTPEGEDSQGLTMKFTPEVVLKIFKKITDEDIDFMGFSSQWSRPEWMICKVFAVPPPSIRPSVKQDSQQRSEDDLTHIIINIIKYNNILKEQISKNSPMKQIDDWTTVLQYYVATIVDNNISGTDPVKQRSGRALKSISERHKGKTGRVRGNLMGKRVDFSARSVITPDPELSITELGVPMKIAMNITKPVYVNETNMGFLTYLVKNGPDVYPGAKILELANGESISLRYYDKENVKLQVGDIVHRHMMNGDYVLFNRQPTLHRMSMMAHIVHVLKKGDTFHMNVADTKPYNADFDGDEMNMHMPQNDEAEMELKYLAAIRYQIISPALNKSIIGIFQDSLLGSYLFTRGNVMIKRKHAMNLLAKCSRFEPEMFLDQKEEFSAYEIISSILPPITLKYKSGLYKEGRDDYTTSNYVIEIENGKMIRGQFEKDSLCGGGRGLIQRINNDFTEEESQVFIDNIQAVVTEYMKTTGYSVGMSDLISNEETNTKINEVIANQKREVANLIHQVHLGILDNKSGRTNQEYFESEVNNILNKASSESGKIAIDRLNKDNRFVNIVKSGSKGSVLNISQMISCLGQQNVDNKRIPYSYPNRTLPHFKQFNDSPVARGFVESSFISGLSPEELFFHAMGGRVGLIDTAVKTSQTGYIQRRLIKGMEDVMVCYDRTVRNNKQKIIQFNYGGTNFDTIRIETSKFELIHKTRTEIYDLFRYGYEGKELTAMKLVFAKTTFSRYKDQIPQLKERAKKEIHLCMERRNLFIQSVSEHEGLYETVYLPISFPQLIQNVKHQFFHQSNQTDLTPMEAYELMDKYYTNLKKVFKPCVMFEIVFYYYLNPASILVHHRFTRDSLVFMLEKIIYMYKKALVNPGEMVGLISAQSIGEPTTQMNLNTFHFAGISTKSNVTRGVPRMEEILALTRNMKNPSMTIYLKQEDETNRDKAFDMISRIENTKFKNFVSKCDIYYDPDDLDTLIQLDKDLMSRYKEFNSILEDCFVEEEKASSNRWVIRLSLDKTKLIDSNITLDEIHFTLKSIYESNIQCFYTDMEEDEVVFRIRLMNVMKQKKSQTPQSLDEEDQIYMAKSFLHNLLNNIVLRGIQGIDKVNLLQIQNYMIYNEKLGDFEKKEIYSLDTLGTNLIQVLALDYIDAERTYSNSIMETLDVLGIEAARKCLFNEMLEVLCFDGGYVNHHHISLLCDRMTSTQDMISIFRHGINNDNIGPIAKASFEETTEMFLKAARHGEMDEMRGVSANIMCGQHGFFGTAAFSVYLNMVELEKLSQESQYQKKEVDVFDELLQDKDDACALPHLKIQHNLGTQQVIPKKDTGYDIEF
jgi:DNA-directed RNA polymerase II subunit RPB1